MLKATATANRAPRGTKPVSQAFFTALESIPDASRAAVGKAALAMIRDEMKTRKEKMKAAAAKDKARAAATSQAAPAKAAAAKGAPAKTAAAKAPAKAVPVKRAVKTAAPAEAPAAPPAAPVTAPATNGVSAPKRRGRKPAAETVEEE